MGKQERSTGGGGVGLSGVEILLKLIGIEGDTKQRAEETTKQKKISKNEDRAKALEMRKRTIESVGETRERLGKTSSEEKKRRSANKSMEFLEKAIEKKQQMQEKEKKAKEEELQEQPCILKAIRGYYSATNCTIHNDRTASVTESDHAVTTATATNASVCSYAKQYDI